MILILYLCHLICYFGTITLKVIIYKYIKKKPLGLQSILDPLILDIIRLQLFNHTFFIFMLTIGLAHGHLPFLLSQIIIFINVSVNNCIYGLYLYFLTIKALVIFKGGSILEVSDTIIVGLSRISALVVVILRYIGDFWLLDLKPAPGIMTKFLTNTDQQT